MTRMSQAVAALKLRLAEMRAKDDQLKVMIRQFQAQLARIARQTMYGRISLDLALGSMQEIEERLEDTQTKRGHLLSIKDRAEAELEALELVQRIEAARARLAQLRGRLGGGPDKDTQTQITRLEEYIMRYSKQAERNITTGPRSHSP